MEEELLRKVIDEIESEYKIEIKYFYSTVDITSQIKDNNVIITYYSISNKVSSEMIREYDVELVLTISSQRHDFLNIFDFLSKTIYNFKYSEFDYIGKKSFATNFTTKDIRAEDVDYDIRDKLYSKQLHVYINAKKFRIEE
jgi:hypothetical protein